MYEVTITGPGKIQYQDKRGNIITGSAITEDMKIDPYTKLIYTSHGVYIQNDQSYDPCEERFVRRSKRRFLK